VLLGNGDGTFPGGAELPAGGGAAYVGVGDFNRDGIQDLVTADYNTGTVTVLLGVGDGTFLPPQSFPAGERPRTAWRWVTSMATAHRTWRWRSLAQHPTATTAAVLLGTGTGSSSRR